VPLGLKMPPIIDSRQPSRSSLTGSGPKLSRVNTVDKYFTDMNGNSLISTLSSSNELFSNI
jgi:hypothetical protein